MKKNHLGKMIVGVVFILFFACIAPGVASENEFGLDPNAPFDIYVGGDRDSHTIIKNVQIVGMKVVKDRNFILIYTDDFAGKRSMGLVALDAVQVILPSFRTNQSGRTQQIVTY